MGAKWSKRLKLMRISKYAIVICLLLSIVFAGFTIYGINAGNFNVYITESDVDLAVYMQDDKSDISAHMSIETLDYMYDATYAELPQNIAATGSPEKGLGIKNDKINNSYNAFSLCLVNRSERAVDYSMSLIVTDSRAGYEGGNAVNAMRVAVIYGNNPLETAKLYAAEEATEENAARLAAALKEYGEYPSQTIYFKSEELIFEEMHYGLEAGGEVKYTFVFWLEGCDEDCVDNLIGGKLKMRLDFRGS